MEYDPNTLEKTIFLVGMSFNVCCLILINESECSALTAFPLSVLGKVTFKKVMHYNIALLPKKVTNYVT